MKIIKIRVSTKLKDVQVYVGKPAEGNHPLQFQANWYAEHKLLTISDNAMNDIASIYKLSKEEKVNFYDLLDKSIRKSAEKRKLANEKFLELKKKRKEND